MGGEWWVSISSQLPFPNRCLQTEQQQCHVMLEWRSTDSSVPQYRCSTLPPCHSDACDSDQEVFPSKGCIRAWCMQTRRLVTTMTTMETELNPLFSGFLVAHYFKGSTLILDMQIWWLWRKKKSGLINRKEISFAIICSSHFTSLKHWGGWRAIPFCKAVAQGQTGGSGSFLSSHWVNSPSSQLPSCIRSIPQHTADASVQGAAPLAAARKFGSFLL